MPYKPRLTCPSCGFGYDPCSLLHPVSYDCCPKCGRIEPNGSFMRWPTRAVWCATWWKPWTWMTKPPKPTPHPREPA